MQLSERQNNNMDISKGISPLHSSFFKKLQRLAEEIGIREREKIALIKKDGAYYAIKEKDSLLDESAPKKYFFRISGEHDTDTDRVEIKTDTEERYKNLVRRHLIEFFEENGSDDYDVKI